MSISPILRTAPAAYHTALTSALSFLATIRSEHSVVKHLTKLPGDSEEHAASIFSRNIN